ncbi:MAG: ABC transporter permease [Candidatus Limnocylindrales bacterium]
MGRYVLTRLLQFLPTLFIASVVVFLVIQASPGDPARIKLGPEATPEQVAIERTRLGLDEPLPVRYAIWLSDAVRLDLGRSFQSNLPVTDVVFDAFGYTVRLALAAAAIAISLGISAGILAALSRGKPLDVIISTLSAILLSLPSFVIGIVLILVFAVNLRWLPSSGAGRTGLAPLDGMRYLIMPAVALGLPFAAVLTRFMRAAMIEAMGQDHVLTARAKGLKPVTVIGRHAVRNALVPTITIAGISLGTLLAGAVVIETVFSYPGLGRLIVGAIFNRDYPIVQAGLILAAVVLLAMSLLVDLMYGVLDPRIRSGRSSA